MSKKHIVSERVIQLTWFIAGIYGTGALWYFLSRDEYIPATMSTAGAVGLAAIALYLHGLNDKSNQSRDAREQLATFLKEADGLTQRANEVPLPIEEHNIWVSRVEQYLTERLDSSYAARFSNFAGMTFYVSTNYNSSFKTSLEGRTRRLHEFIAELAQ